MPTTLVVVSRRIFGSTFEPFFVCESAAAAGAAEVNALSLILDR
jgi:hypothetical protein